MNQLNAAGRLWLVVLILLVLYPMALRYATNPEQFNEFPCVVLLNGIEFNEIISVNILSIFILFHTVKLEHFLKIQTQSNELFLSITKLNNLTSKLEQQKNLTCGQ